jgi:hypothetical protein
VRAHVLPPRFQPHAKSHILVDASQMIFLRKCYASFLLPTFEIVKAQIAISCLMVTSSSIRNRPGEKLFVHLDISAAMAMAKAEEVIVQG